MQTFIIDEILKTPEGAEANRILRSCVHCGFCTATCPTYRLLGDELDSPRGRIYLIKNMLEGGEVTRKTQLHLDRCLTCRTCETYCPSGVEYARLLDTGRRQIEARIKRLVFDRWLRFLLRQTLPYRKRFAFLLGMGRMLRPFLPSHLRRMIPPGTKTSRVRTRDAHQRHVILFTGCVQPALRPQTNEAAQRVLDRLGISAVAVQAEACCGAIDYHMAEINSAVRLIKNNIDRWWPYINSGAEAIVTTASGCGMMIRDYAYLLRDNPEYAARAERVSALARDISEIFSVEDIARLKNLMEGAEIKTAFQNPCSLQHGQKMKDDTEVLLATLGFRLCPVPDSYSCCGSAGVYSLLHNEIASQLRSAKVSALLSGGPEVITTANIGCQMHLQQATDIPVKHWIEVVDDLCRSESV
jgi:glycolate oxidase iron-sulfur subunit